MVKQRPDESSSSRADRSLLTDLVRDYLEDVTARGCSGDTVLAYRGGLRALLRFLTRRNIHELAQVREVHLASWATFLKTEAHPRSVMGGGRGPRYQRTTIRCLIWIVRRFFSWLVDSGHLLLSPAQGISVRDVPVDPLARLQVPTEQQVRLLFECIPKDGLIEIRDWAVLELLYSSGLRIREVQRLDVADLDLDERVVRIRQGKGRKDRVVPIGKPACQVLRYWLDVARPQVAADRSEQALFVSAQGRRLVRGTFSRRFARFRRLIGLGRLRVHDFRHASALHMVRHGADLRHVQEFLGHARLSATQIYTRLAPDDLKAVHAKAHPRERHKDRS